MVKSMTGFGRMEETADNRKITIEMKSVNHKYLDMNLKLPKRFHLFESRIRSIVKEYAIRGKIDLFLTYENLNGVDEKLRFNRELAGEYMDVFEEIQTTYHVPNDITTTILARFPDVLTMEEAGMDEEETWSLLEKCLRSCCEAFSQARIREGEHLKEDFMEKLDGLSRTVEKVEVRSPQVLEEYRSRLEAKLQEVLEDHPMDDSRIAQEVVIFSDKMCVDEEVVRLKSHIHSMREELLHGENQGRKLDFIAQEMNREANTILSKANDLEVTNLGIELKTEIEKIREQIQNIE